MRRPAALALSSLLVLSALCITGLSASAQEPSIRLTLLEQSPQWNDHDHAQVAIRFRAENTGSEPLDDISVGITLWPPVFSRTAFEASLSTDPSGAVALLADTRPQDGSVPPGGARDFEVKVDLSTAQLDPTHSLIYPLRIDLRSGYTSLAAIRTPVVYLVREPLYPLAFSWTFDLEAPLLTDPDGTFSTPALETSISSGGRLAGELAALSHLEGTRMPVDLVVSPLLLLQLVEMKDGYRVVDGGGLRTVEAGQGGSAAAAAAIEAIRAIARSRNVEVSTLPYSEPLLPSLASGGLSRDLAVQLERGRDLVSQVLGRAPSTAMMRPPGSAIDQATLDDLAAQGVSTLLLDPTSVIRAEDQQGFAPPPVVALSAESSTLSGVVADPSVQSMLGSGLALRDPVLASQAILGELASIWLQRPGEQHGLAMVLGDGVPASGAFFGPLVRGVESAPWLAKRTVTGLVADPDLAAPDGVSPIVGSTSGFSSSYAGDLKRARRRVETMRSMLVEPSSEPDHLDQLLLLAESQRFVGDEAGGLAFLRRVDDAVGSMFAAIRPQVSQPITLASSAIRGVPIAIRNAASIPLRVTIRLVSPYLRTSVERTRVLAADSIQTISLDLELKTTGRFPVQLQVVTPSGRVIARSTLIVRSTAYNRIALVITLGAGLLAMLVWARRFIPRRTR